MAGRASSQVTEAIPAGQTNALARVGSAVVEVMVWVAPPPSPRRVSSLVAEVIPAGQTNAYARVGSVVVEVMSKPGGGSVMSGYWW